ncbi:hypothetical protein PR202_gb15958 [Eleusine coracana subsp. coracana]|uniref:Uncharacterized protein n=1 Tax=Eleusine coracana subsp. coracana TaxID=191504 RepID=A0AAV5EZ91_ELECO|nr:hypothetical protein PR202_gb15958 [Eleusine coracana subsp. coracana]
MEKDKWPKLLLTMETTDKTNVVFDSDAFEGVMPRERDEDSDSVNSNEDPLNIKMGKEPSADDHGWSLSTNRRKKERHEDKGDNSSYHKKLKDSPRWSSNYGEGGHPSQAEKLGSR